MAAGGLVRVGERQPSIEDALVELVGTAVADAIARAEARGEERARALKTHLSIPEAALALGVSKTHLKKYLDDGTVPSLRLGERVVIPRRALEDLGVPPQG